MGDWCSLLFVSRSFFVDHSMYEFLRGSLDRLDDALFLWMPVSLLSFAALLHPNTNAPNRTWGLSFYVLPSSLCPTFLCTNPSIDDLSISSLLKLLKWPVLCTIGVEVFVFYLAGWCRRFPNEKGAAVGRFLVRLL